jgi:hypothetical protein
LTALELTIVPLPQDGVDAALALIPAAAGVGQVLAEGERNLVIGRPSNLRRWAAGHLGRAKPPKAVAGKLPRRPPTDLTPIAVAVAYVKTTSPFAQRLAFERLMARYVPLAKRRDLKRPAYLRLAPVEGYPHLHVESTPGAGDVFGPFRDTRAATRARDALYKHFRVRPCDFDFKPAAGLPAGLADEVAGVLEGSGAVAEVPAWVRRADGRSLVVERGVAKALLEVYPIAAGGVIEEAAFAVAPDALETAIDAVAWPTMAEPRDDTPWLNAWRHGKRTGVEVPVAPGEPASRIAARIRSVVG